MQTPSLSVVMTSYNDAQGLRKSIDSILNQDYQDFELIVVDDGSSDDTHAILAGYVDHPLMRIVTQTNQGITKALINGCALARGRFIARHDADDESIENRFSQQVSILTNQDDCVMVSAATSFQAPDGETMYVARLTEDEVGNNLKYSSAEQLKGPPHHGSVMFRKSAYEDVGGYRKEFYVAQDLDLWSRLLEQGSHRYLDLILYKARFSESSISARKRMDQVRLTEKIAECIAARQRLGNDLRIVENLPSPSAELSSKNIVKSDFYHFVGSTLLLHNPKAARKYLRQALSLQILRPKTILKLIKSYLVQKP